MKADAMLPFDPGPARVLVVEDEPKLAALLADYLRAAGHEPECVADGREVLPAWTARRHDLILLDLMLPGLDGLTLCRELRAPTRPTGCWAWSWGPTTTSPRTPSARAR